MQFLPTVLKWPPSVILQEVALATRGAAIAQVGNEDETRFDKVWDRRQAAGWLLLQNWTALEFILMEI